MGKILFYITVAGAATIISCSKNTSPAPPPPSPAPTLSINVSPVRAWYSGTSTISWSTTNTDSVHVNGVKVNGNSFITPVLTAPVTYTITAFGPGGTVTQTVTASVWSQKITLISNYGNWKNIYSVRYKHADSLNPALYDYLPIDSFNCRTYRYLTNSFSYMSIINGFKGEVIQGCGDPTVTGDFAWNFESNETQISYGIGPSINWNVDTLNTSLFRISQDRPDSAFPGIIFRYVLRFVH